MLGGSEIGNQCLIAYRESLSPLGRSKVTFDRLENLDAPEDSFFLRAL